jgi:hypothetical protein
MGHQNHEVIREIPDESGINEREKEKEKEMEKNPHPFLEKNDITFLSIINPLLSPNGQKLVSFFINFGNQETRLPLQLNELVSQLATKQKNPAAEMLPTLLGMLSGPDQKNALNPAVISTLLSMFANRKED